MRVNEARKTGRARAWEAPLGMAATALFALFLVALGCAVSLLSAWALP